jgi:hypothetical protein
LKTLKRGFFVRYVLQLLMMLSGFGVELLNFFLQACLEWFLPILHLHFCNFFVPVAALWWVCQEIVIRGFFPRRHERAIGWWPWNQQISAAPICAQNCTSRHLHQWAGKLSCRIDSICCQGSWDPWNCNLQPYLTVLLWNVLPIMGSAQRSASF